METYPISSLYLDLPTAESREHFHGMTGRHASVLHAAKKRWADPFKLNLQPSDRVSYLVFNGQFLVSITMSALEAANVNFPDSPHDALPEILWPCRPLTADERIVFVDNVAMVEKGTS